MEKIKEFESPLIWGIDEKMISEFDSSELSLETGIPFLDLIHSIMESYIYIVRADYDKSKENLEKTDKIWNCIDQTELECEGISIDVVNCIMLSIKYYILQNTGSHQEVETLFKNLKKSNDITNLKDLSTLNGCKSIAWSIFHEEGAEKAIQYAKLAVRDYPNCSVWHFILGKNLRRIRRLGGLSAAASFEEIEYFLEAYKLIKNPLYGIYVAQSFKDQNNYAMSRKYIDEVRRMKSLDDNVLLRLAVCYIRLNKLSEAKDCLDNAEKLGTTRYDQLMHYKGLYYLKLGKKQIAAEYFKKTSFVNCGAQLSYAWCMSKIDKNFNLLSYYSRMLKTCRKEYRQQLLTHIGIEYYKNKEYEEALVHFVQSIAINPKYRVFNVCFILL